MSRLLTLFQKAGDSEKNKIWQTRPDHNTSVCNLDRVSYLVTWTFKPSSIAGMIYLEPPDLSSQLCPLVELTEGIGYNQH